MTGALILAALGLLVLTLLGVGWLAWRAGGRDGAVSVSQKSADESAQMASTAQDEAQAVANAPQTEAALLARLDAGNG
ncbi:hypothetical protein [Acidomonas methanolica]|uniref:Uncharacterized protein n=1 Tax=Acidomonas methanolica NBRC 104435 TaxID=1231351 RepID=A0A023D7K2_ACIMT|nr:hypothetical protein [Acidomonas methanolica]TCS24097.1 hypothetical protein EDC31_12518 [Acidomonas methanolica]GAJ29751.1 hypothetical protein Amme_076_044 [Acidomonas methanolica NBRC 104435]GBQ59372.1 hypothetical protein AA0498_2738 [Acidomonas methanolica]GEL00012.1 hypothetical protein AME01nite_25100 [Acidomonas methanolica NBRC 104435]